MRVNKKRARMVLSVLSFVIIVFSLAATIGAQTYEDIARRSSLATTLETVEGKLGDTIGNSGLELQEACNKTARDETSEKITAFIEWLLRIVLSMIPDIRPIFIKVMNRPRIIEE